MDTLHIEDFQFEPETTIFEMVDIWVSRQLWFFEIIKNEKISFSLQEQNGHLIKETNGEVKIFSSEEEANNYILKETLTNSEIIENNYTFYTAKNDLGRFIMNNSGLPIEFESEKNALRSAIHYNNDLAKIRLAASQYRTK